MMWPMPWALQSVRGPDVEAGRYFSSNFRIFRGFFFRLACLQNHAKRNHQSRPFCRRPSHSGLWHAGSFGICRNLAANCFLFWMARLDDPFDRRRDCRFWSSCRWDAGHLLGTSRIHCQQLDPLASLRRHFRVLIFNFIRKKIFYAHNPVEAARRFTPLIVFIVVICAWLLF